MKPVYQITHPHALSAIWLAHKLHGLSPSLITRALNASGVPRPLFVLAGSLHAQAYAAEYQLEQIETAQSEQHTNYLIGIAA